MKEDITWSWLSEDNILIDLGSPTDSSVLDAAIKIERLIDNWRPAWLLNHCYGFGKLSLIINTNLVNVDEVFDWLRLYSQDQGSDNLTASAIVVEACYDPKVAPDLLFVCDHLDLSPIEVIQIHCDRTYRVWATGFAPGFGYLGETDTRLHMPRKDVPLIRVPAGSLAIASNQTVIYPTELPGGWHLIGRVASPLVTITEDSISALLRLGHPVRFEPISYEKFCKRMGS